MNLVSSPSSLTDWVDEQRILNHVEAALARLESEGVKLNSMTFSGFGESTLYPKLAGLVKKVKDLRDRYSPSSAVTILTNSSLICTNNVFEALKEFDTVVAKLDVGTQNAFQRINRYVEGTPHLDEIVEEISRLSRSSKKVTIQSLIFRSNCPDGCDNTGREELKHLAERIRQIDPLEVQVYTVKRVPSEPYVSPADQDTLEEAASMINSIVGRGCAKVYV
jgi:wyosine [tRNA(Phe)-imidazoG37] synthetase (radical SAM superfamily)